MLFAVGRNDLLDGQAVGLRKGEVALVVRGHRHDRAGAVRGEHVVGDPDGDALAGEHVRRERAGVDTGLRPLGAGALDLRLGARRGDVGVHRGLLRRHRDRRHERVLRCQHHEGGAVDRVGSRREEADRRVAVSLDGELDLGTLGAADPVLLHDPHALRPVQAVEPQQLIRVCGDLVEPLGQVFLHDGRVAALAEPIDDLLVREHGLVARAPVHGSGRTVGQALLQELEEHPLVPAVVLGVAGDDLATPVDGGAERSELLAPMGHVLVGPRSRMDPSVDRRVLGVDAERVEAHREQHVVTLHPDVARLAVRRGHRVPVADVHIPRRVREHRHEVVVRLVAVIGGRVEARRCPVRLPLRLDRSRGVALGLRLAGHRGTSVRVIEWPPVHRGRKGPFRGTTSVETPVRVRWS